MHNVNSEVHNERSKLEKFVLFMLPITLIGESFGAYFGYNAQGINGLYGGIYYGALISLVVGSSARILDLFLFGRN